MNSLTTIITLISLISFQIESYAIVFSIKNNCPYTVWAAAVPGGGRRLDGGQTWNLGFPGGPKLAKIWARTGCSFNSTGRGGCRTGDCDGWLRCRNYGSPPHTLAEYGLNSFAGKDYYDISLMKGFNVPMEFAPTTNGCRRAVKCAADISGQCPEQLRAAGGCQNPCTVYKTAKYCCGGGRRCRPTALSKFFKSRCRDAFTFPEDDPTSTFVCPPSTDYRVVFCPN
ncbi:protein P21-like [Andrographis paniculata]|uniref:protein P21-like n=1 Tax=Andrographis paniculata TaxID=175694 RepID=UPI0021E6DCB7|nr:protein P21-like [Andrographis paniculata]